MIIRNLPALVNILSKYNNPYLLCQYKGIDWAQYVRYNQYKNNINIVELSPNLNLVSLTYNQSYKIHNKDFIYILDGDILINNNKRVNYYFLYENNDNKDFVLCNGLSLYNSFLYYKHL